MSNSSVGMRIVSIKIKNYGWWEDLFLEFPDDPKSRQEKKQKILIYGGNNTGKSSIARALKWLAVGDDGLPGSDAKRSYPKNWKGRMKDSQEVSVVIRHEKYQRVEFFRKREKGASKTDWDYDFLDNLNTVDKNLFWEDTFGDMRRKNPAFYFSPANFLEEAREISDNGDFLEERLNFSR